MLIDSSDPGPDMRVAAWIGQEFRKNGASEHLRACNPLTVSYKGMDSVYGCDTGCEYARLEATITCPHGESEDYEYGQFGELADLLEDIFDEFTVVSDSTNE